MGKLDNSPKNDLSPSQYAERIGLNYSLTQSPEFKKKYGQYITPSSVANFMAGLINPKKENIAILDPGAGAGVLSCALLEHISTLANPPKKIKLTAYEIDEKIIPYLKQALDYSKVWLSKKQISLTFQIKTQDFILENANAFTENTLFPLGDSLEKFDYIISNPPYFKLSKSDQWSKIAAKIVHGQPNIYAIFMMLSALLLNDDGELVFITPRSYAAGPYFKAFREQFFTVVQPVYIHLFGSRKDAFDKEAVLQENIILKAIKDHTFEKPKAEVMISFSNGIKDLNRIAKRSVPITEIIDLETKNKVLRIPITDEEDQIVEIVHSWKDNLHSLGWNISTGPVVAFRAEKYLSDMDNKEYRYAPLLWMQHIKAMSVSWPNDCKKKQFIEDNEKTQRLLLPNKNYVVIRRFSAKEEDKRLVAAPYLANKIKSDTIGLENHLNYIYKPAGNLSIEEVVGLAALLNSNLLDTYFRTSNGNTQVSATELKDMPLPSIKTIANIGKYIIKNNVENGQIDKLVHKTLVNIQ